MLKNIFLSILFSVPLNSFASLSILTYHHIADAPKSTSVSEDNFEQQIKYLKDNNYIFLTSDELKYKLKNKSIFDDKYVVITFDDAWRDQLKAVSILEKNNLPAIFFVNGKTCKTGSKTFLSIQNLKEMNNNSLFTIADHSYSHNSKVLLSQRLEDDYNHNQLFLKELLGKEVNFYAYPYGRKNHNYMEFLKEHNIELAFGVESIKIHDSNKINIYNIPRFNMNQDVTFEKFKKIVN